ncbi:MAG TPA: DUF3592 domain-containing protein [Elusimicrobiales bacterium]|nr:DUF3592 domain-containing protein [Elusimicrobiales bacterium]
MSYTSGNKVGPVQSALLGGALLLLGIILLKDIGRAQLAALSWPKVRGGVTSNNLSCSHSSRSGESCNAYISYTYSTDSGEYSAANVEVLRNDLFSGPGGLKDKLNSRYPEGRSITVYYNPENPSESNLGPGNSPSPIAPAIFILLGIWAFYVPRRQ